MESLTVHHLEFGVLDGPKYVQKLISQFHFQLIGRRATPAFKQWVVASNAIRFLITELLGKGKNLEEDPYVHSWAFTADKDSKPVKESVFNIAFRVKYIESLVTRSSGQNVQLIKPLQTVSDEFGSVRVCMVKSCVGNIVHTLVDDSGYSGPFLPGFQPEVDDGMSVHTRDEEEAARFTRTPSESVLDFLDHVAMYIPRGSSGDVISWYDKCFGMTRFFVTREDDVKEGLVVDCDANQGVRMKVLEFYQDTDSEEKMRAPGGVKLVAAETLPESGPGQIDTFFANHGGPGVGHVALHTKDLISTVSQLRANGAMFGPVPYTYYTEAGRLKEMIAIGVDVDLIKKNKILIDLEEEQDVNHSTRSETDHNESSTAHRQREDDGKEGLVVTLGASQGMRLKVLEFSKDPAAEEQRVDTGAVRFVAGEKLPESGPDEIDTFIDNHGGPGVGHVALHTKDLISTVSQLRANGAMFGPVPYSYYTEVGRLQEMIAIGVDVDLIRKNGILIDLEEEQNDRSNVPTDHNQAHPSQRYLMQIFTQPLSGEDSFHLEFIQRVGAKGFGTENVKALRRSMQAYLEAKEAAAKGTQGDVNTH